MGELHEELAFEPWRLIRAEVRLDEAGCVRLLCALTACAIGHTTAVLSRLPLAIR